MNLTKVIAATFLGLLCLHPASLYGGKPTKCRAKRQHTKFADFGKTAFPLTAFGVSVFKQDWLGAVISQVLAHGLYVTNRKFEHKIDKRRPCGCKGAFPSGHMIMYATSSSYLHYRYGWQYGLPAYIATAALSYDRVRNKAHSWGDMLGTFTIANVLTYVITPRLNEEVEYLPNFDNKKNKRIKLRATQGMEVIPVLQTSSGGHKLGVTFRY